MLGQDNDGEFDNARQKISDLLARERRPGGWVILIQTRWHEDDLAGRPHLCTTFLGAVFSLHAAAADDTIQLTAETNART
jgi:hypothetical protein